MMFLITDKFLVSRRSREGICRVHELITYSWSCAAVFVLTLIVIVTNIGTMSTTNPTTNPTTNKGPQPAKKHRAISVQFPPRIPVVNVICFLLPKDRLETAALLSKHWSVKELESRQSFFYRLCCTDGTVPSHVFRRTIDYRLRYNAIEMKKYNLSVHASENKGKSEIEILAKFNDEYTMTLCASTKVVSANCTQTVQIFQHPVVASFGTTTYVENSQHTAKSLCFDLAIDTRERPVVDATKDTTLQIWVERVSDHKVALFSTIKKVFNKWKGFQHDGKVYREESYDTSFEPDDGFQGGWGFSEGLELAGWSKPNLTNPSQTNRIGIDTCQYQFEVPSLPDFDGVDEEDNDAVEALIEEWQMTTGRNIHLTLSRIKVVYLKYENHGWVDSYNPENLEPSDLRFFIANARWI